MTTVGRSSLRLRLGQKMMMVHQRLLQRKRRRISPSEAGAEKVDSTPEARAKEDR